MHSGKNIVLLIRGSQYPNRYMDTLSVNIAWLSDEEQLMLLKNAEAFKTGMIRLFNDERFNFSISTGTGQKYNVDLRFTMVKSLIKEIISL